MTEYDVVQKDKQYCIRYAIYFAYRYFRDFGLGGQIRNGLISQFL